MADMMTFPETVEEYMEQYKITDTEQIYTNGAELVPIFRMKRWFEHKPEQKRGEWIYGEHDIAMCDGYRCDQCGFFVSWDYKHKFIDFIKDYHWCPSCGADMRGNASEK